MAALAVLYVSVYFGLTLCGRYEPAVIGPSHVKSLGWAPYGFYDGTFWKPKMMYIFTPMYLLDKQYWHTDQWVTERPGR